ncbi:MAG: hypothetical protein CMK09_14950 [Ponticaulis sp.]|nr:hypothetical protein [Ponticaulis sp.]|tara:strand:+ start:3152 stop:4087 length:936 start_codon:yes stop_codon:yes gene_type:complete
MTHTVLTDWDSAKAAAFEKENIVAHHNMHDREIFSDEGLIELLDRYPRERMGIYTMQIDNPLDRRSFRAGNAFGLTGAELLRAVEDGRIWINMRNANDYVPAYEGLTEELFDSVEAGTPGLKTLKHDTSILISSPNAQVFYHFDVPLVMLWQIRGVKNVWLYPPEEPYLTDHQLETVVLKETEEEIDFEMAYDRGAQKVRLEPGMVATWPQNGPHRIVNEDMVNVSLSCEFQTLQSLVRANAIYANGVLRRNFGMNPRISDHGPLGLYSKAFLARFFKILKLRKSFELKVPRTFEVDPGSENAVRDIQPQT